MTLLELRAEIPLIFVGPGSYFAHISAGAGICRLRLLHRVSDAFILHFFSPRSLISRAKNTSTAKSFFFV